YTTLFRSAIRSETSRAPRSAEAASPGRRNGETRIDDRRDARADRIGGARAGAGPARAGGESHPRRLQAGHRKVLQPGPAGRGPHQGLHEAAPAAALRALQGSALPGLAARLIEGDG